MYCVALDRSAVLDQLNLLLGKAAGAITHMDRLTLFGLVAVTLMLVFYALEDRSRHFSLAFAGACMLGSAYGFLQGAWPFGFVEGIWSLVALRKWWQEGRQRPGPVTARQRLAGMQGVAASPAESGR